MQKSLTRTFAKIFGAVGHQLRCPSGLAGWLTGHAMALVNREPYRLAVAALSIATSDTILELGFGPGRGVKALADATPRGLVLGIDQSSKMLAQASSVNRCAIGQGRVQLRLGRFDTLPWQSETINKVLAVNVIYFFGEKAEEISEARRVLRPGGRMAIYATDRSTMSHWTFSGPDTHRLFGEDELCDLAIGGGFSADEVSISAVALPFGVRGLLAILHKQSPVESPHRKAAPPCSPQG